MLRLSLKTSCRIAKQEKNEFHWQSKKRTIEGHGVNLSVVDVNACGLERSRNISRNDIVIIINIIAAYYIF